MSKYQNTWTKWVFAAATPLPPAVNEQCSSNTVNHIPPAPDGSPTSKEVSEGILPIGQSRSHKRSRPANDLQAAICHQPAPVETRQPASSQTAERVTCGQRRKGRLRYGPSYTWICFKYSIKPPAYRFTSLCCASFSARLLRFIRKSFPQHISAQFYFIATVF